MKFVPLVSVIIPMYNAEQYIEETLLSLKNQTFKSFEVIIVDNASTDNSIFVAQKMSSYFNRFLIIQSDYNSGGPAKPRNIGVEKSTAEYIAFLDSDDLWHEEKLSKQIEFMLNYKLNFSSTSISRIDNTSKPYVKNINSLMMDMKVENMELNKLRFQLFKYNFITLSSTLIKKELLEIFSEDDSFMGVEDYRLWLMIMEKPECKYKLLCETLVDYRVLRNSASRKNRLHQGLKEIRVMVSHMLEIQTSHKHYLTLMLKSVKLYVKCIIKRT